MPNIFHITNKKQKYDHKLYEITKKINILQENMHNIYGKIRRILYNKYIKKSKEMKV